MPRLNLNHRLEGPGSLFQLNISLVECHHPIWRRILIPKNSTFKELHLAIQGAFQWRNYHLYQFTKGRRITIIEPDAEQEDSGDDDLLWEEIGFLKRTKELNPRTTKISSILKKVGDKIDYEYDFGDSWEHLIKVEAILDPEQGNESLIYPICTGGVRKGPPEDCGSFDGYEDLCRIIAKDPLTRNKEQRGLIKWLEKTYPGYGNPNNDEFKPEDCKFQFA